MKYLFDNLSMEVSRMTTKAYSTSFSLGIYFLNSRLRKAIYSVYGFVRLADEIVDSFEGYDKKYLLKKFEEETYWAIENGISVNPILNSFQHAVREYQIDQNLIETFLDSMAMDLQKVDYTVEKYRKYIFGSAEAVGLMCLQIFAEGDTMMYNKLKPYAMKLGAAFQKVNFLRDMRDDYHILGRIYFPGINISDFNTDSKREIEREIEDDFKIALEGIKLLPSSSKSGVYLAYIYYLSLFDKIKKSPAQKVLTQRIRINNGKKFGLMINSLVQNKMNWV